MPLNSCLGKHEGEGDEEAEDEPHVDHLRVRRWRQLRYLAREDGRHHQHDGQIDLKQAVTSSCESGWQTE